MSTPDDLYQQFQNIIDRVAQAQDARCDYWADYPEYQASMNKIMNTLIGPIADEAAIGAAIARELLAPITPPPPPPPPPSSKILAFGGTYPTHGFARDIYGGFTVTQKLYGPHHGIDLLAPSPGRVEAYAFQTPLNLSGETDTIDPEYAKRRDQLFMDWVCMAPPVIQNLDKPISDEDFRLLFGTQNMYVSVFWPDTPLRASNGQAVRALWGGHCRQNIPVGRVETGQRILTSWDSGVRFENNGINARAAHIHLCGSATGVLSPNGDVDGFLIAELLGIDAQDIGTVPGPNEYMTGQWIAGRRASEWIGHPIPPIPA